jgi:hypothetical protein
MATNLQKRQQGEQFSMIDPPSLPQKPYFPDRLKFSLGGLGFGVALGLAIALLFEFLNPKIYEAEDLQDVITPHVFITVPPQFTAAEQRRALKYRILESAAGIAMAIVIPAVTFFVYYKG